MKVEDLDIQQLLGSGGFAFVYQAKYKNNIRNSSTQQQWKREQENMALKIINKEILIKDNIAHRIVNEIKIHRKLNHPSFVKLIDFFENENNVYMCLELCNHGNFYHFIKQNGPLTEYEAGYVMYQLIDGLNYLHNQGIVHRDLKLSNILISSIQSMSKINQSKSQSRQLFMQEEATLFDIKICDFGLAASVSGQDDEHYTLCGTPNYIAPEIASQQAHGFPVDIWSAGCLFYSMVEGALPFDQGEDVVATLRRVVNGKYKQPSHLTPTASDFLNQLLEMNPLRRPTASALLHHPFLRPYSSESQVLRTSSGSTGTGSIISGSGSMGSTSRSTSHRDALTVISHTRVSMSNSSPSTSKTGITSDPSPIVPVDTNNIRKSFQLMESHISKDSHTNAKSFNRGYTNPLESTNRTTGSNISRTTPVTDTESPIEESSLYSGCAMTRKTPHPVQQSAQIPLPKMSQSIANVSELVKPSSSVPTVASSQSAFMSASNASGSSWLSEVRGLRQSLGGGYVRESTVALSTSTSPQLTAAHQVRPYRLQTSILPVPTSTVRSSWNASIHNSTVIKEGATDCVSWIHLARGIGALSYCAPITQSKANSNINTSSSGSNSYSQHQYGNLISQGYELVQVSSHGEIICVTTLRDKRGNPRLCRLIASTKCTPELVICSLTDEMRAEVDVILHTRHGYHSSSTNTTTNSSSSTRNGGARADPDIRASHQNSNNVMRRSLALDGDEAPVTRNQGKQTSSTSYGSTLFQVHPSTVLKRVPFSQLPRALVAVNHRMTRLFEVLRSRTPKIILYLQPRVQQAFNGVDTSSSGSSGHVSESVLTQYESCKCMLMMNGPLPDFCVQWKNGARLRYSLRSSACSLQYPTASGNGTGKWEGCLSVSAFLPTSSDNRPGHVNGHAPASLREYLRVAQLALARCLQVERTILTSVVLKITHNNSGSVTCGVPLQPHILCESL